MKINLTTVIFVVILLVFAGTSFYVARRLRMGIIPDEGVHFNLSRHFATTWGIPPVVPETYRYGPIGHKPFLYYWINGRILNIFQIIYPDASGWKILSIFRLLSVFYAFLSVIFAYLLAREVIQNKWMQLVVPFLLTSTIMFVFLAGGVNYDNLVNLTCFASVYFLVRVMNGKDFYFNSFFFLAWTFVGSLVKITALPFGIVVGIVWIFYIIKNRRTIDLSPPPKWVTITGLIALTVLVGLNISIYGINLIRYRTVLPACTQILTAEQCNENPVVRRDQRISLSRTLTAQDILLGRGPDPLMWTLDYWLVSILEKVYGILGHRVYHPGLIISLYRFLLFWIIVVGIKYWKRSYFAVLTLLSIAVMYTLVLLIVNYKGELSTGFSHAGIQGRYIFPVINVIYTLGVYSISVISHTIVKRFTLLLTLLIFAWGSPLSAYVKTNLIYFPENGILPGPTVGEISGKVTISQEFTSQCSGSIQQIELYLATYARENTHPVYFHVLGPDQQVIAKNIISAKQILDNSWFMIPIPDLVDSKGKTYRINITSPESLHGNAITIYRSEGDDFPSGRALVDNHPLEYDLQFRYLCWQRLLPDWFYTSEVTGP